MPISCISPLAVTARILQAAGRRVAYHTFAHVLDLDISFHLERRTGALSRVLERGTRSIAVMFRAIVFTFIPTIVELVSLFIENDSPSGTRMSILQRYDIFSAATQDLCSWWKGK